MLHSIFKNNRIKLVAIVVVIITAIIVGVVMACSEHSSANAQEESAQRIDVEIPVGRYYPDGNSSSALYIEILEGQKFQIVSPDLQGLLREYVGEFFPSDDTEGLEEAVEHTMNDYAGIRDYRAVHFPALNQTVICVRWSEDEDGFSGHGFTYTQDNAIEWSVVEQTFVLVKQ